MSLAGPTNTSLAVVRDQELSVHEQLDIARRFESLHKHATTLVIQESGLEEVQGESDCLKTPTSDAARCPDASAFSKIEYWHSDMTYEIQPLSTTSLKVMAGPEYGGDTLFMLFIPASVHKCRRTSRVSQLCTAWSRKRRDFARLASASIASPSKPYTLSSVSPGWKSVYVNPGVTRRMLGVPNVNPTPFSMSCSTRSPRMLTSECDSTGNRIQLRSDIRL
ncbi:hypothetical protein CY34DRAFT_814178 [Suillus luteus UH-Slu-Lm8-n1]|uniref:TauD/TfdA-like domain-containing protein n=1 Tax=Suillus luteus UH-Slu-Lm8-n1 TaxID=930992 RepID=A0A0C9ZTH0_9AGAM|nr:hypothetical protein CY34DRAFT_814178 [Suillus luteus UH-Slu-Lm8-n1]